MNLYNKSYGYYRHNSKFHRLTNIYLCEFTIEDLDSGTNSDNSNINTRGGNTNTDKL